ncbi:MAG: glycosyltransferase family 1 protein, partial [Jaaginema sp. PMC 1079.18]|nr:glycosyltransferase family 1 protein [Jaaginema sp. PMC 1079.18]
STPKSIALISVHGDPAVAIGQEEAGGQNVYVRQVGEALAKQGWHVDMFSRRTDPDQETIIEHGPRCRTIRLNAGKPQFIDRNQILQQLPEFVESFLQFQEDQNIVYPLIHTNYWLSGFVGMELCRQQASQMVHTYHSLGVIKYRNTASIPAIAKTRLRIEQACLETADCVVATSPQEKEHMRAYVSQRGNIEIIPCGTEIERFGQIDRATARQKLGIPLDEKMVMYVGRFDPRKGIETLVRAIGHPDVCNLPNLHLYVAGGSRKGHKDGQECDRIKGIVSQLGLSDRTSFPGRLNRDRLALYFSAADVCVVPSHYEPFGLVAIEAMASRTPVVASAVGGLQFTVVPEKTGLLAPPQDDKAFAAAIARLLNNPQWCEQLGDNARDRVEKMFSWGGVAEQLDDLYCELLNRQKARSFYSSMAHTNMAS